MKFIMSEDGTAIVNVALVEMFYVDSGYNYNSDIADEFCAIVWARISADCKNINLKTFYSSDEDKAFAAAKTYLAALFAALNGGEA